MLENAEAPVAKAVPTTVTLHGEVRTDDYAWLRDRDDPAVTAYLEAENAYTAAMMRHTEPLQQTLYAELLGRIKEDDTDVPERRGEWRYSSRTQQGEA
jgi:oligopeptidase B